MSIEKNKKLLKRQTEELWIKKNPDKIEEFFAEDFCVPNTPITSRNEIKEWLTKAFADETRPYTVKTDYHEMIGEGDTVATRQTNHMSDGTTVDGVTIAHFKDGKITANFWFIAPEL